MLEYAHYEKTCCGYKFRISTMVGPQALVKRQCTMLLKIAHQLAQIPRTLSRRSVQGKDDIVDSEHAIGTMLAAIGC